jgi:hypothetical protein
LPDRTVQLLPALSVDRRGFGERGPHRLEEAHLVADGQSSLVGHSERERLGELDHMLHEPPLTILQRQDVLHGGGDEGQALGGVPVRKAALSKPKNRAATISYFSCMSATATSWGMPVSPWSRSV